MKPASTLKTLKKKYPDAKYYLNFSNPLELLVAAILSAQCRDEVVNATTKLLFKKYKTAADYTELDENDVKSITFFKNKARNIKEAAKTINEKHKGKVPQTIEQLTELPGIGRKTANAIMQNAFGVVEGIIIDTYGIRIPYRLGWTKNTNPDKIEQDLMKLFAKQYWKEIPWLMKELGRDKCRSPVAECSKCVLEKTCPKIGVTKKT